MSWPLSREALLVCLLAWLCAITRLGPASAKEPASERADGYLVVDMPEWLEDYGHDDTHEDGSVARGARARGSRQCNCLRCRDRLTGDWCGARTRLEDSGIKFDGNISQFAFGQGGGINTPLVPPPLAQGGAFSYTGRGDYGVTFDLEKFGGLPKGTLAVRTQQWWGTDANVNLNSGSITLPVFPTLTPTAPNDPGTLFMTDFMFTQPLSKNFVVFAGKKSLAAADDDGGIGGGSGFNRFMNLAVVGNPSLLLAMPYSSFMVGMVSPQE